MLYLISTYPLQTHYGKILCTNLRARIRYETNYYKKGVLSNFSRKELEGL